MQTVQLTVEILQVRLLDKVVVLSVVVQDRGSGPDSAARGDSIGAVLGQVCCRARRCATTGAGFRVH